MHTYILTYLYPPPSLSRCGSHLHRGTYPKYEGRWSLEHHHQGHQRLTTSRACLLPSSTPTRNCPSHKKNGNLQGCSVGEGSVGGKSPKTKGMSLRMAYKDRSVRASRTVCSQPHSLPTLFVQTPQIVKSNRPQYHIK